MLVATDMKDSEAKAVNSSHTGSLNEDGETNDKTTISLLGKDEEQAVRRGEAEPRWGWVIAISSTMIMSTLGGFQRSETLFYHQLLNRFDQGVAKTAGVSALANAIAKLLGPVMAAGCTYFGHRRIAIMAGILTSIGFILTAYAPALWAVYIGIGVMQSLGNGMFMVAQSSLINSYFSVNRGKANALGSSALNIGGLYMPHLLIFLFNEYGYTGALLIMAGLTLHMCPVGGLFIPLAEVLISNKKGTIKGNPKEIMRRSVEGLGELSKSDEASAETCFERNETANGAEQPAREVLCSTVTRQPDCDSSEKSGLESLRLSEASEAHEATPSEMEAVATVIHSSDQHPMNICKHLLTISGLRLLRHGNFFVLCLLMFAFSFTLTLNLTLLSGLYLEKGLTVNQVAFTISIFSPVLLFVRFGLGVIFDFKSVRPHRRLLFGLFANICSFAVASLPVVPGLIPTLVMWFIMYVCLDNIFSQSLTVMSDLLSESMITPACGSLRLVMGIGSLLGPLIGGTLAEVTGSYSYSYYLSAMQLGAVSLFFQIFFQIKERRNTRTSADNST